MQLCNLFPIPEKPNQPKFYLQSQMKKKKQQNSSPPWQDLNPYILTRIFACLSLHDQLFGIPYVCHAWLSATLDVIFHNSNLDLRLIDTLDEENQRLRFAHLLKLAIDRYHGWVSIYFPSKHVLGYFGTIYIAERAPNISSVILPIDVTSWALPIYISLPYWKKLRVFHARLNQGLLVLSQLADYCKNIVELGIHGKIGEQEVLCVIEGFPRLRVLDISESTLSSKALGILLDAKLKCLKELNILHCLIEDDDGKDIRAADYYTLKAFKKEMFEKVSHLKNLNKFINCLEISCQYCKDIPSAKKLSST